MAGWTGLETVFHAFDNQLMACELWSQVLQYVSVLNKWDVTVRPREHPRVDPVRGDILETWSLAKLQTDEPAPRGLSAQSSMPCRYRPSPFRAFALSLVASNIWRVELLTR